MCITLEDVSSFRTGPEQSPDMIRGPFNLFNDLML